MGEQLALIPLRDPVFAAIARSGLAASSLRRYARPCRLWEQYCADRGVHPADAPTPVLLQWLDQRVRKSNVRSQIRVSLAALSVLQRVYTLSEGIEPVPYTRSARPMLAAWCKTTLYEHPAPRQAKPLLARELQRVVNFTRANVRARPGVDWNRAVLLARRDCALLLLGWWGAFRADDLRRLEWRHIEQRDEGVEVVLEWSKTKAARVAIARQHHRAYCPVHALEEWRELHASECAARGVALASEPIFYRSPKQIDRRFRECVRLAGLTGHYTAHSLRSGFATEAHKQGVPDRLVQRHARWKSSITHAHYIQAVSLWDETPTKRVQLTDKDHDVRTPSIASAIQPELAIEPPKALFGETE